MNPHAKEDCFLHYLEEKTYGQGDTWRDTGLWVRVGGLGLIICTINVSTWNSCNVGFRLVDETNTPLPPYRKKINSRHSAHFSFQPTSRSQENLTLATFHMVVNCQYAKIQVRPSDDLAGNLGELAINVILDSGNGKPNAAWNHKPISTMSVLPLVPHYQGGANTIFTYPQSRMPRMPDDDKPDKIKPSSSSGVPLQ